MSAHRAFYLYKQNPEPQLGAGTPAPEVEDHPRMLYKVLGLLGPHSFRSHRSLENAQQALAKHSGE